MVLLDQIKGQERSVAHLRRALDNDRVAHAYLFVGPENCGKHTTALAFAAAMNCLSNQGHGCGTCEACQKIASDKHPDVQTLERQGAARIIPIDTIRTQVIPRLASPPHEGRVRVFLIEEATSLAGPSANALLKTLEEPPPRTHFVLGTSAADKVLPTIRSRCQRINFAALPADIRATLADDTETAERLTTLAEKLETVAASGGMSAILEAAAEAGADRAGAAEVLGLLTRRYHEAARQAAADNDLPRASALSRRAARVMQTETAVTLHNAHGQLALERLLVGLRTMPSGRRRANRPAR